MLPEGMIEIDTGPGPEEEIADSGYPTRAADILGDSLWLGRDGGLRRYDRKSGEWSFHPYNEEECPGYGTVNVVAEPPFVWARRTSTGRLCRYNPQDDTWHGLSHWTVISHTGPGFPLYLGKEKLYVASTGSPDWEGVSLIDRETEEWIKLLKTKSASCIYVGPEYIWLGVPEGVLKIDKISEEYQYHQPYEHGGGAFIKDLIPIPGGMAFATIGKRTGILGDRLRITKDSIQVYMESSDRWFTYDKKDRDKVVEDLHSGKIIITNIKTNPGLLILKNDKWNLITVEDGLVYDEILDLDKDDRFLYVSSARGISVFELTSLKPVPLNEHIFAVLKNVRRIIADDTYIWVFSHKGLYRVEKRRLFSSPR